MCNLLTSAEHDLLDALPELEPPTGTFTADGQPNLAANTLPLVDEPTFRAYLIQAGRYELMIATKGEDDARDGHTGRTNATGFTPEQCRRVALAYWLRLGAEQANAHAA
jgi:hypothetical protein